VAEADDARRAHWAHVYEAKAADSVSWYQPVPEPSLSALDGAGVAPTASVVDVGGGASRLVDVLLARGFSDLTVLDVAAPALGLSRARLGAAAERVTWIVADVTRWRPERRWDVWHDRAVFHFLTDVNDRAAYRCALEAGTAAGSVVVIATFAPDGPERCSGLPVQRWSPETLAEELGPAFALERTWREAHHTPAGATQTFQWTVFRRT
jgi:hypothetical protein